MSTRNISIGGAPFSINYDNDVMQKVTEKIIEWLGDPNHYAAHSGEGIIQSDNTVIDAPYLIGDILDEILKPEFIKEAEDVNQK